MVSVFVDALEMFIKEVRSFFRFSGPHFGGNVCRFQVVIEGFRSYRHKTVVADLNERHNVVGEYKRALN